MAMNTTEPLGWVTMTDRRVSDPVYRTREDAEKDAELLRARGIETKVAGVYLTPPSESKELTPQIWRDEALMEAASIVDSYIGCDQIAERIRALMGRPKEYANE